MLHLERFTSIESSGRSHSIDFFTPGTGWSLQQTSVVSNHDFTTQLQSRTGMDEHIDKESNYEDEEYAWGIASSCLSLIRADVVDQTLPSRHELFANTDGGEGVKAITWASQAADLFHFIDTGPCGYSPPSKSFIGGVHWIRMISRDCVEELLLLKPSPSILDSRKHRPIDGPTQGKEYSRKTKHSFQSHGIQGWVVIIHLKHSFRGDKAFVGRSHPIDFNTSGWSLLHTSGVSDHYTAPQLQTRTDMDEHVVAESNYEGEDSARNNSSLCSRIRAELADHTLPSRRGLFANSDGGGGAIAIIQASQAADPFQFKDTGPYGRSPSSNSFIGEVIWMNTRFALPSHEFISAAEIICSFEPPLDVNLKEIEVIGKIPSALALEANPVANRFGWSNISIRYIHQPDRRKIDELGSFVNPLATEISSIISPWQLQLSLGVSQHIRLATSRDKPLDSKTLRAPNMASQSLDEESSEWSSFGGIDGSSYKVLRLHSSVSMLLDLFDDADSITPSRIESMYQTGWDDFYLERVAHDIKCPCTLMTLFLLAILYYSCRVRRILESSRAHDSGMLEAPGEVMIKLEFRRRQQVTCIAPPLDMKGANWANASRVLAIKTLHSKAMVELVRLQSDLGPYWNKCSHRGRRHGKMYLSCRRRRKRRGFGC